jgi:Skp family chaperone for outer membrane proteins
MRQAGLGLSESMIDSRSLDLQPHSKRIFVPSATQRSAIAVKRAIFWSSAVVLLAGVLTLGGSAWSQNKDAQAPANSNLPHKVGLIDMAHVFKHYKKFEFLREDLKDEVTAIETKAKEIQTQGLALQQQLRAMQEGSPDFAKIEQEIGKKQVEFESFRKSGQRELLKKEAAIYLAVYNETSEAVKKYADYFKYTLVIRFNRDELDSDNPQALLSGMNRQVVYHRGEDDITISVLDYLNKQYAKSAPAGNGSGTTPAPAPKQTNKPPKTDLK